LLTLGLFLVVINGFIVYLSQLIVPGFDISSFLMAVLFSLLLSFFILVGERIFGLRNQS
ncbi:MAG: phage holin family protein, partial [Flavobacteriales bacterium]|nr:phage holin family protein [Flavobacteriales bacterium]